MKWILKLFGFREYLPPPAVTCRRNSTQCVP